MQKQKADWLSVKWTAAFGNVPGWSVNSSSLSPRVYSPRLLYSKSLEEKRPGGDWGFDCVNVRETEREKRTRKSRKPLLRYVRENLKKMGNVAWDLRAKIKADTIWPIKKKDGRYQQRQRRSRKADLEAGRGAKCRSCDPDHIVSTDEW